MEPWLLILISIPLEDLGEKSKEKKRK